MHNSVSNQPQAAVVPVRKDLRRGECYDLITQVATLDLRLEDELGVRGRECTID